MRGAERFFSKNCDNSSTCYQILLKDGLLESSLKTRNECGGYLRNWIKIRWSRPYLNYLTNSPSDIIEVPSGTYQFVMTSATGNW